MSLLRTSRVLSSARGQLQIVPRLAAPSLQQRQISSTPARKGGDAHGDPYDPPTGWLFGVKPGDSITLLSCSAPMMLVFADGHAHRKRGEYARPHMP